MDVDNQEQIPPHMVIDDEDRSTSEPQAAPVKKIIQLQDDDDFDSMNIRPESIFLRGCDELSPRNLKIYLDHYIRPDNSFANHEKYEAFNYKIEWINDSSLNVVFKNGDIAKQALELLSADYNISGGVTATDERKAQPYINEPNEDKHAELYIRQSFSYDKKIKNAREYSRYYLLNGEPDEIARPRSSANGYNKYKKKNSYRERETFTTSARDEEPDLLTGKIAEKISFKPSIPLKDRIVMNDNQEQEEEEDDLMPQALGRSLHERIGSTGNGNGNGNTPHGPRNNRNRNRQGQGHGHGQGRARGREREYGDDDRKDLFPSLADRITSSTRDRSRSPIRNDQQMDLDS